MPDALARDLETVQVADHCCVAIGGSEARDQRVAAPDRRPTQFDIVARDPAGHVDRRGKPQHFLDRFMPNSRGAAPIAAKSSEDVEGEILG
jgi:hypothetical protein